ncbi:MAG TPA: sulfate adenylyltransferase [Bacillota bacterium]|nr:sulfate adenylyltransferase [Bacillota bacterium]
MTPHGGELIEAYLTPDEVQYYTGRLPEMKRLVLDPVELSDLELLANGAFSPLKGFMGSADYFAVLENNRLADGWVWTIPITLSIPVEMCGNYREGEKLALVSSDGKLTGILELEEIYHRNREKEALQVYGTLDRKHPGVRYLLSKGEVLLGGKIKAVADGFGGEFSEYRLSPRQLRQVFAENGWKSVVAFQTRNPIHRAHEYLQKVALEMVDALLIHPLVGFTKPGDIPSDVRMACYQEIIARYYPADRVKLAVFPAAMRYAGPKEAVFHAIVRKNYGCTHFIVGRDHAGVGNYYGTYDAQNIFDNFSSEEIGITILKFENTFYCKRCGNMASAKTCPHGAEERLFLSGTKVREMLQSGLDLPEEFTRPEVARILKAYYAELAGVLQ